MALRARLALPPRLVDWSLFALVGLALTTGVTSFWVGHPSGTALLWTHAIVGLSVPPLLLVKFRRVAGRVRDRRAWDRTTPLSVALAVVAVAAAATGIAWAVGVTVPLGVWTLLNLHILFGLLGTPAATSRFTGSREHEGSLPVTSWVADDPDPVDPKAWTLSVEGLVERPLGWGIGDLDSTVERRALLDCTSGWYAERDWRGVRLGDLLDEATPRDDAAWVTVHSVTGYRWSLPLGEADDVLLATHLSGDRLDYGHGYPLRLVAPGRRGFQWVKWVETVEIRRRPDPWQWVAIFVSGR